jgi:pimeloyl-ACP methyl ester carboxylesterase
MSINLEDVDYPHPVSWLPLVMEGVDVRLAFMDVAPSGEPNGRTVVLLHGMNFFGAYWERTVDALRGAGYRVVVPDQVGFGRSSKPIVTYSQYQQASQTRELLDALGVERAVVVGHSMGGMIATRFAFLFPDRTEQLVLVNPIGLEDTRPGRPWRSLEEHYRSALARDFDQIEANIRRYYVEWQPEAEAFIRIHYGWVQSPDWPRLAMVRALHTKMFYEQPVVYDWPHIRVPTLLLGGAVDGPNFPELAGRAAATIPGASLILLEGVGHNPHLEAPERFHPELLSFLSSQRD